jgi:amino-acid N-acetyltransferase
MKFRKAKITDVEPIHALITYYAEKGLMLARPRTLLYENLREFTVAVDRNKVVGAGSLHINMGRPGRDQSPGRCARIRENRDRPRPGQQFLNEARELAIPRVFVLTYQDDFFAKCGFRVVPKESLPQKVWKECVNCPKFPNCEEIAMIIDVEIPAEK